MFTACIKKGKWKSLQRGRGKKRKKKKKKLRRRGKKAPENFKGNSRPALLCCVISCYGILGVSFLDLKTWLEISTK